MNTLGEIVESSSNIVFFGGAGVSTESGIPDFRSADGLYNQKYKYPPEKILSHSFFAAHTKEFYEFYKEKILISGAKPNRAHYALAKLEEVGKLKAVITQNIDGFHQMAGSKKVLELHGSVHRNYCIECGKFYDMSAVLDANEIPHCNCGSIIKPDVVLYEETLDEDVLTESISFISNADVLIVGGTSLSVYPAAGLISYYGKNKLVLINRDPTPMDYQAALLIKDSIGDVLWPLLHA